MPLAHDGDGVAAELSNDVVGELAILWTARYDYPLVCILDGEVWNSFDCFRASSRPWSEYRHFAIGGRWRYVERVRGNPAFA